MDRLTRNLAGFGLALIAAAGGCRAAHDEVPPGKVYRPDGRQDAEVGFSTAQPNKGPGNFGPPNMTPGNLAGGGLMGSQPPGGGLMGSQPPGGDMTGTVPGARFGAPGTSGGSPSMSAGQPAGGPLSGLGQPPALGGPSGAPRPDSTYINGFPNQAPANGAMGSAGQPPSPL